MIRGYVTIFCFWSQNGRRKWFQMSVKRKKYFVICAFLGFFFFLVQFIKGSYATSWKVSPGDSEYISLKWPLDGRHPHLTARTTGSPHGGALIMPEWSWELQFGLKLSPGVVSHHWDLFFFFKHKLLFILWISSRGSRSHKGRNKMTSQTKFLIWVQTHQNSGEHLTSLDISECLSCQFWSLSP